MRIIQLDAYNIKDIHPFEFYRNVSYMSQTPAFFSGTTGTIRDNIQLNTTVDHERLNNLVRAFGVNELMGHESIMVVYPLKWVKARKIYLEDRNN